MISATKLSASGTERLWLCSAAVLFAFTGIAKLHAGLVYPETLPGVERVFGMPFVAWSVVLGLAESCLALALMGMTRFDLACRILRLVFVGILGYRILLYWEGGGPCACLGHLLARTPLQEREGLLLWSVALLGAVTNEVCWAWHRRRMRKSPQSSVEPLLRA